MLPFIHIYSQQQHLVLVGHGVDTGYLGEFSIVFHNIMLNLTLISCHLNVLKRRQVSVYPFIHNSNILVQRGNEVDTWYLGEFLVVFHDLVLNLTLISCRLEVQKIRQVSVCPFTHNGNISFQRGDRVDTWYIGGFFIVFNDLVLDLALISCRLNVLKRRQVSVCPFIHNSNILVQRGNEVDTWYLGEFLVVFYDLVLNLTLISCRLKFQKRRQASVCPFTHNSNISFQRGDRVDTWYIGGFFIVFHDLVLNLALISCRLKAPKRRWASVCPFIRDNNILFQRGNGWDTWYLGELLIVFHDLVLNLTLISCHLKVPKRWLASVCPFTHNSNISFQRGNRVDCDTWYIGGFFIVFHDLVVNLALISCRLKVMKRWQASIYPFIHSSNIYAFTSLFQWRLSLRY
jgi:hypothetical protein